MTEQPKQNRITVFAETNFRNQRRRFGIKRSDRLAHTYLIGKTGTGKSTLIANLAHQDLIHGGALRCLTRMPIWWNKPCASCPKKDGAI